MSNPRNTESIIVSIVEEVAEKEGIDPIALEPIHYAVDSDALCDFLENPDQEPYIEFHCCGYEIAVDGTDHVEVSQ